MSRPGITTQEAVAHLGLLVRLELDGGGTAYGRVDGADETKLYLGRATPANRHTVELSSVMVIHCIQAFPSVIQSFE
jgi:hypothetical protein